MPRLSSKEYYYAVRVGRQPGVYRSWDECKTMTQGYAGAVFKKFNLLDEATQFVNGRVKNVSTRLQPTPYARKLAVHEKPQLSSPPAPAAGELDDAIIVYTDGASSKNGRKDACAGVGVYFGENDPRNISEPLQGTRQTNQRAELTAIQRAIEKTEGSAKQLHIYTDSMYSINCLTNWFHKWERNNWVGSTGKPVDNQDIIKPTLDLIRARNGRIRFFHVRGHMGILGNEKADELAVSGCA
ncbi:hypothetical protein LPJ63_001362 [Coemansia sp. RSA 2711]|nr:hypothetical protein LPJ63_001362 [Coemansia sp. RSA 2711]KAJ2308821.1 hypothetical protein IWW54_003970 [Coemansia sp. RSA 2705]KAJ2316351.1 hypothetical protein IWW52_003693 [Coemansia sp. RSA 2704]KAJ2325476.1 hypothetical protein IWW51_002768 [Coemansia sp. RSA 2702]KAJ2356251.1 hypothetical protein H4S02_012773 [Coemansia sp. RSA 2611]KAJ2357340.1 hypothetical protein H4S01_006512 [Coemansia sp. RSA 2610]KAJ2728917.1 hypothetical protein H4R23_003561 [Coemansia sp. Cherry 401B]